MSVLVVSQHFEKPSISLMMSYGDNEVLNGRYVVRETKSNRPEQHNDDS